MGARVIIRADAGPAIGAGHLMRCRALGMALRDAGADVVIATGRAGGAPVVSYVRSSGVPVHEIDPATPDEAAMRLLGAGAGAWIVADGYHFDAPCLEAFRRTGSRVAVIEDSPRLPSYDVNLLLDQNPGALRQPYAAPGSSLLLGPRFILLRPDLGPSTDDATPGPRTRVLITTGGSDPFGLTQKLVEALSGSADLDVTVVLGAMNDGGVTVPPDIRVARGTFELPRLMRQCDIAVSAVGTTLWELACLGIPTIAISTSDLHARMGAVLQEYGAHRWIGDRSVEGSVIRTAVSALAADDQGRREMSRLGRALVDSGGAARVAAAILGPGEQAWRIRRAVASDAEPVWEIAADPEVRRASHDQNAFSFPTHERWFEQRLSSATSNMWVADGDGTVAGFVRYDWRETGEAVVSIAVASAARGRGLAARLLSETCGASCVALGAARARGYVFPDNHASIRAFKKAGFAHAGLATVDGRACVVFEREAGVGAGRATGVHD